jgi:hypothetical protein
MKIRTEDLKQFYNVIENLVKRGLGFNANSDTLEIELTGSY